MVLCFNYVSLILHFIQHRLAENLIDLFFCFFFEVATPDVSARNVRWDKRRAACGRAPSGAGPSLTFSTNLTDVSDTAGGPGHVCNITVGGRCAKHAFIGSRGQANDEAAITPPQESGAGLFSNESGKCSAKTIFLFVMEKC